MAKQLNIDMRFNADTAKAKQAINDLEKSLQQLGHTTMPKEAGIDPAKFEQASASARELEFHLKNAFNTKTGNLDLSKLDQSLKSSGTNLKALTSNFTSAGSVGQQAFTSLARAIATADQPSLTLNTHLQTMLTTLGNVARFQFTSSIMHGLVSGVNQALGFAKDLNESLNNIRIVTGQSTDQMARFAEQANKSAKALSATTLDYTNASLIYYQQGLSDADVAARTETTIKLANVSRQSAEEVSDQMTAIWNNFAEGSENLEYYADVITALGAATASSSDEIAGGLEKFASVAKTVGLSYEYASSALATIVATTRQSEDTIGTGLRTLFARFEGLKLGETLEDGVELNKYSKALKSMGVDILDASGNMRQMDEILDDMGKNWEKLTQTQKIGVAQTVGGVRQYTNLIALMDNWDFFKQNLEVARGSEGTLQEQAEIYAESWEAARNRVKAAAESIYDALIDDEFFIQVDNVVEYALSGIGKFIKGFGGVKNIVVTVLSFVGSMVANKIGPAVQKVIQDIQILSGGANKVYQRIQNDFANSVNDEISKKNKDGTDVYSTSQKAELQGYTQLQAARAKYAQISDKLSAGERMRAELAIQGIERRIDSIKKMGEAVEEAEKKAREAHEKTQQANADVDTAGQEKIKAAANMRQSLTGGVKIDTTKAEGMLAGSTIDVDSLISKIKSAEGGIASLKARLGEAFIAGDEGAVKMGRSFNGLFQSITHGLDETNLGQKKDELRFLQATFEDLFKETSQGTKELNKVFSAAFKAESPEAFRTAISKLRQMVANTEIPAEKLGAALKKLGANPKSVDNYVAALEKYKAAVKAATEAGKTQQEAEEAAVKEKEELAKAQAELNAEVEKFQPSHEVDLAEGFTKLIAVGGKTVTVINAVKSAYNTLNDSNASFGEKLTASLTALSLGVPSAISAFSDLKDVIGGISQTLSVFKTIRAAVQSVEAGANATTIAATVIEKLYGKSKDETTKKTYKEILAKEIEGKTGIQLIASIFSLIIGKKLEQKATEGSTKAKEKEIVVNTLLKASMWEIMVVLLVIAAAIAVVVFAIKGIIAAIQSQNAELEANKKAAEEAANTAQELTTAYEDAKNAYEDLKESVSAYEESKKAIDEMIAGTQEWKDQIRATNDQALELINTYGLIKGKDYRIDENGIIQIEQSSLKAKTEEYGQRVDTLGNAAIEARNNAREAKARADLSYLKRSQQQSMGGNIAIGAGSGALMGASVGVMAGPLGAAIGAALGAAIGGITAGIATKKVNTDSDERITKAVERLTTGDLAAQFKNNEISEVELKGLLDIDDTALLNKITDLAQTINTNTDIEQAQNELIARSLLSGEGNEANETTSGIGGKLYGNLVNEAQKAVTDSLATGSKDYFDQYAHLMGLDQLDGYSANDVKVDKENNRVSYSYIDDSGDLQTKYVPFSTIATAIGTQQAEESFKGQIEDLNTTEKRLSATNSGRAIAGIATGDLDDVEFKDIDAFKQYRDQYSEQPDASAEGFAESIKNSYGLTDDIFNAIKADLEKSFSDTSIDKLNFDSAIATAIKPVQDFFSNPDIGIDTNALSANSFKGIKDFLTELYVKDGENYDVLANDLLGSVNVDKRDEFLEAIGNYDWSTGSLEGFKAELEDLDIVIDNVNLDPWIEAMLRAQGVVKSFDDIDTEYAQLNKITKDLNMGDTISKEDLDIIKASQPELAKFFTKLDNGTYKLMQDGDLLRNKIAEAEVADRQAAIDDQQRKIHAAETAAKLFGDDKFEAFQANMDQYIKLGGQGNSAEIASKITGGSGGGPDGTYFAKQMLDNLSLRSDVEGIDVNEYLGKLQSGEVLGMEELTSIYEAYKKYFPDLESIQRQSDEAKEALAAYSTQVAVSSTSVGDLQDNAAQYGLNDKDVQAGYESLATATDEGREALNKYRKEIEKYGEDSKEGKEATQKFQKAIKDIQANKAAEEIRKISDTLEDLEDWQYDKIAKQLQSVFGKEVTGEFVKNHKDWVNQWLNGTEEQRQEAANMIDNFTGLQGALDQFNETTIKTPEGLSYLQNQLEMNSYAANLFANNFSKLKQLLETGVAEIDGMTFNINGTASFEDVFQKTANCEGQLTEVATRIKELNNSSVSFEVDGSEIPAPPDLESMDIDDLVKWMNTELKGTSIKVKASGEWSAHAGKPEMTSGGSKGGGGGGGGGKNSTKEKKEPTDEKDRYHTIREQISDTKNAYDELSKAEDRAFGKERVEAMKGITDNLKEQIELQKEYLDEIKDYLVGDREAVEALGATFDANGVITNYDALIEELVAKYNEGVDKFNAGGIDEDAFKEQYEEPFNDAKEAISQYVETINLLQSEELNLIDLQNDLADQLREIAAYKLELHIDIDEDELQYLDFLIDMLGEDVDKTVDKLGLLGQQFNTNRDEISAYTTAIQDLLRLRGFSDEDVSAFIRGQLTVDDLADRGFTTDDIDKLREYRDAIQDNTTAMRDLAQEIEDSFLDTLDELNDQVKDAEDKFDHFAAILEHFHNVVDIVGQDALGMSAETMKLLAKSAKENAIEMVKAAKTQLDSLKSVREQAQAQLDAALEAQKNASTAEEKLRAEQAVAYWRDTIDEVSDRVAQAEEDLADALENALEGIKDMYTVMIEQSTKEFERQITGAAGSLEQLQTNFERQKETQDLYIPTYEKIYELTKLTRDINNSIDDTDNLWSKQELAKLQDEINQKMEDGVELTEHDVEELRKRYELKLAEAALEEAQDAKRTVRMSRDNEGNWSYVYTADEDDVAAAEQNYEDKLFQYQQMNYEYIQELQANIIQAEQDMTDQINDLDVTKFASKEAYLAEIERIMEATMAKEQQYRDQLEQTLDQQGMLYENDWARYNELTGYRMARDDDWVDNWNETILAQETGFQELGDMFNQLVGAIGGVDQPGTYVGDIGEAYADLQEANDRALKAAGTSMKTYEEDTLNAVDNITTAMKETQEQVDSFSNDMKEGMEAVSEFIGNWQSQYGDAVKSITEFNKDLYESCNTLIQKLQDTFQVNADFEAAQAEAAAEALGGGNRGAGSGSGNGEVSGGGTGGGVIYNPNPYNPPNPPNPEPDTEPETDTTTKDVTKNRLGALNEGTYDPNALIKELSGWMNDPTYHWKEMRYKNPNSGNIVKVERVYLGKHRVATSRVGASVALPRCSVCGRVGSMNLMSGGYTGTWSAASARTGMYTGSWNGPDLEENGRLAFLHQKELVLNASDTENFLSAIDMVRQISSVIDLQAASRSNGWGFALPGVSNREPDTLDQNVHIEAHFPNVTSHSEIEEAFANLVGKASQFANR